MKIYSKLSWSDNDEVTTKEEVTTKLVLLAHPQNICMELIITKEEQ